MATLNIIPETKQSPSAMRGVINYCLDEKKTFDINSGRKLITGVNCVPQNAYTEFMTTKAVYHQERGFIFITSLNRFLPKKKSHLSKYTKLELSLLNELGRGMKF